MMLPTIDDAGFHRGWLAEAAVNDKNSAAVVQQAPPAEPPADGAKWRWDGQSWVAATDYRGRSWYNPDDTDQVHAAKAHDDAPPVGWVEWLPGAAKVVSQEELTRKQWVSVRAKRNQLLIDSDWTDTLSAAARLGQTLYDAWQNYRQALRDVPQQLDPFNITWPQPPN